ncbi:hypothetical protein EUX98_g688 [Antrodiella citrinella]|uniref:CN hydrolase domain-containing protein n=1 Tax=Antrodiella citrinella TaxID=2447956 RepID=A0A4S4N4Y6_9APHY|nr:hypothetical protein EUX98_g688 [Antrodiella citrinella]
MARDVRAVVVANPTATFLTVCPILALFALTSTPGFIPIISLVTSLRVWTWVALPRTDKKPSQVGQILLVSLAAGATQLAPTLAALSSPTTSLLILSLLSVFTSSIAFIALFVSHYATRAVNSPWSRITIFPAIWATTWGFMSRVSPLGHLANWSPVLGVGAYGWTREVFGQWGIDWVTAAWAVVFSEILGDWLVAVDQQELESHAQDLLLEVPDEDLPSGNTRDIPNGTPKNFLSRSHSLWSLAVILILLAIPSYVLPSSPLPPQSSDTTSFTVGCALPASRTTGKIRGNPTLQDYIHETQTLTSAAPIVLWPEGAVRFASPEEKQAAFDRIQQALGRDRYVGVSFIDYTPARREYGLDYPAMTRNGFALLAYKGPPVMEYYKRNLVPIAESFSLTPGNEEPSIYTLELRAPKSWNKTDWAPAPNYTRPIPITASICFDFASSSSFTQLESRPAIILAPARTWHLGIGNAMWEQAKARAKEAGSVVVWCDGGPGGVSGVASRGHEEILQVGQGSWTSTVGLQWPFDERRSAFIASGQFTALVSVWGALGLGWIVEIVANRRIGVGMFRSLLGVLGRVTRLGGAPKNDEERPLLHD